MKGFDLDEETVETFDAILLALTQDPELREEFKKLKFIQSLKDKYDGSKGPIKQIMEKLADIEQLQTDITKEHVKTQTDMRRAVADMTEATRTIRTAAMTEDRQTATQAAKKLEGMEHRLKQYSWNHNDGT
jgi:predicted  nucleic acid-binding Zn-ribbon protein